MLGPVSLWTMTTSQQINKFISRQFSIPQDFTQQAAPNIFSGVNRHSHDPTIAMLQADVAPFLAHNGKPSLF